MSKHNTDQDTDIGNKEIDQKDWQTPGIILRSMRKQTNLEPEEICQQLGLTRRTLSALEADEYDRLPAETYVRGYIRRYCNILNIDEAVVLASYESYKRELNDDKHQLSDIALQRKNHKQWLIPGSIMLAVIAMIIFWAMNSAGGSKQFDAEQSFGKTLIETLRIASRPRREPGTGQPESHTTELLLSINEDSWIEVIDNRGEILLADLKRPGEKITLHGQAPFDILLGRAAGVTLSYAGMQIEPPYSEDGKVKFKVGD